MTRQQLLASALAAMTALAPVAASAQIFGDSDEVKAARQAHEDAQDAQIAQLQSRIQQLEDKVRGLTDSLSQATGNNENLAHQLDVMSDKLDRQNRDFTYRLCTLSAQQMGADQTTFNCANGGAVAAAPGGANPQSMAAGTPLPPISSGGDGTQPTLGRPPGILGTLPANPPTQMSNAAPLPAPSGGPSDFDAAMNLLAKAQYAEASAGFRSYADNHPDDTELSPQAIYWIGQIKYVQQDYPGASHDFAELIKKYPKASRAPDAMLKLGQSLLATGQKPEGCTALGALKAKFPDASDGTVAAAASARKAAGCVR
jgi:tol-pal system protein YbgF